MKKILAFLIAILCFVSCFGCTAEKQAETTQNTTSPQDTQPTVSQAAVEALDGKKIIFVGNSYTYYGHCVLRAGSKLEQAPRTNDQGYFYQLCKSRGAEVSVTNWTFGDHSLWESLGESCTREACYGVNHLSYLTDRYFDYVVLQGYNRNFDGDLNEYLKPMMDIFREANPNVKFLFAVPHQREGRSPSKRTGRLSDCRYGLLRHHRRKRCWSAL